MENIWPILLGTIFINNLAFTKLVSLGQLAHFGDDEKEVLCIGSSAAVIMGVSTLLSYLVAQVVDLGALDLLVYMLVVLLVTEGVKMVVKGRNKEMFESVKGVLPLLAANSAIFYLLIDTTAQGLEFLPMLITAVGAPIGLLFAFILYGAVRERLAVSHTPKPFKGLPILLVYAALVVLALSGLNGIL